jgi:outer membrane autotransporter protein
VLTEFFNTADWIHQKKQQQQFGFHTTSGGAAAGYDYRFSEQFYLGLGGGYTCSKVRWDASAGKGGIQSYYGGVYGTWFDPIWYVNFSGIVGQNFYDAKRNIHFSTLNRKAKNHHSGYNVAGSLGTGFTAYYNDLQIQPYAVLDTLFLHQKSFTESGAESLDMHIHAKDSIYFQSDLGIEFSRCYATSWGLVVPELSFGWIWEKELDHGIYKAQFTGSSCTFSVSGFRPTYNLFAPRIGLIVFSTEKQFRFSCHYDPKIGRNFFQQEINVRGEWGF